MRVLLAEDSKSMRNVICAMLRTLGATEIIEVDHGGEAWDVLRRQDVDLVITDWNMPVMSGMELLDRIRHTPGYEKLPVILSTIRNERADVIQALRAGADAFLSKPYTRPELRAKMRHAMGRRPARRVERVLTGTDPLERDADHPLVIVAESAVTAERLGRPDNQVLLDFLTAVADSLHFINTRSPDLHIGYILESSSTDVPKRIRSFRPRVKMLLLDTDIGAGAVTLARMVSINKPADLSVFLVCESTSEFPAKVRFGLERLGVTVVERYLMTQEALDGLFAEYIISPQKQEVSSELLTPEEISKRMEGDLRNMVDLPVLPQVYQRIVELDKDPESDLDGWIEAIESDPLTRAQVIRRSRSPLYGFRGEINEASKAVILLGKKAVKEIVVSGAMKRALERVQEIGFSIEEYWIHSVATAMVAKILTFPLDPKGWAPVHKKEFEEFAFEAEALDQLKQKALYAKFEFRAGEDPFVSGIMHDLGKVALTHGYPGLFGLILKELEDQAWTQPMRVAEDLLTGSADHTVAGGILADAWKLGDEVKGVITDHHREKSGSDLVDLIALADFIAGGIYPFPSQAQGPARGLFGHDGPAVDDALKEKVKPFLSEYILPQRGLRFEDLVDAGRAIEPTVRKLVENIRNSA